MPQKQKKSLVRKLAEACDAVGGVEKKGRNEFQKYNYVKAADVAKAIRHELFRRGILVLIDEKAWTEERQIKTNSGDSIPLMRLHAEITFRDEYESVGPINAYATAFDSGDKAIYKAKTGLLKYALRGLGLIPDEKDDPEADENTDLSTDGRVLSGTTKTGKKSKKLLDVQIRAFDSAAHQSGKTAEQVAKYLKVRWSATSISELSPEDFPTAIKWAMGTEELAETMQNSLAALKKSPESDGKPEPVYEAVNQ